MALSVANSARTEALVAPMHEKCEAAGTPFGQDRTHGGKGALLCGAPGAVGHRAKLGLQAIQLLRARRAACLRLRAFWAEKIPG
jgi:alanine dehydrogenase